METSETDIIKRNINIRAFPKIILNLDKYAFSSRTEGSRESLPKISAKYSEPATINATMKKIYKNRRIAFQSTPLIHKHINSQYNAPDCNLSKSNRIPTDGVSVDSHIDILSKIKNYDKSSAKITPIIPPNQTNKERCDSARTLEKYLVYGSLVPSLVNKRNHSSTLVKSPIKELYQRALSRDTENGDEELKIGSIRNSARKQLYSSKLDGELSNYLTRIKDEVEPNDVSKSPYLDSLPESFRNKLVSNYTHKNDHYVDYLKKQILCKSNSEIISIKDSQDYSKLVS